MLSRWTPTVCRFQDVQQAEKCSIVTLSYSIKHNCVETIFLSTYSSGNCLSTQRDTPSYTKKNLQILSLSLVKKLAGNNQSFVMRNSWFSKCLYNLGCSDDCILLVGKYSHRSKGAFIYNIAYYQF